MVLYTKMDAQCDEQPVGRAPLHAKLKRSNFRLGYAHHSHRTAFLLLLVFLMRFGINCVSALHGRESPFKPKFHRNGFLVASS